MAKKVKEVIVDVSYPLKYYDWDFTVDKKLTKQAEKFKGEEGGSWAGMGVRDIDFYFKSSTDAKKFISAVKKWKGIDRVCLRDEE